MRLWRWLAALAGFSLAVKPLFDPDNDWHLAAGRWMVEHRSFISTDPFSYTFEGKPWVSITWLHEVLTFFAERWGGDAGFVTLAALLAGGTLAALFAAASSETEKEGSAALFLFILGVGVFSETRWAGRPEMWSHLIGSLFVLVGLRYLRSPTETRTALKRLVPLQILWANTHGVFIMGPILCASIAFAVACDGVLARESLATIRNRLRGPLIIVLGVTAACLVNPRGFAGATFPLHLWQVLKSPVFGRMIPEALSPFRSGVWGTDAYTLIIVAAAYGAFIGYAFWKDRANSSRRAERIFSLTLYCGTTYLAATARRNIPLLTLWCAPLAWEAARSMVRRPSTFALPFLAASLALCGPALFSARAELGSGRLRRDSVTPEGIARFLEKYAPSGRSFTTVSPANYLLRRTPNRFKSYIDSRFAELYDVDHFLTYMNVLANPALLEKEIERWGIDFVIVGHDLPLASALVTYLASQPQRWELVYLDAQNVAFASRESKEYAAWAASAVAEWKSLTNQLAAEERSSEVAYWELTGIARALSLTGQTEAAQSLWARAAIQKPGDYLALSGLCNVQWMSCSENSNAECAARAYRTCAQAVELDPNQTPALVAAGLAAAAAGKARNAEVLLEHAITLDPLSFEAAIAKAQLLREFLRQNPSSELAGRTLEAFEHATRLRPTNAQPLFEYAELLRDLGDKERAREAYRRALALGVPPQVKAHIEKLLSEPTP